MIIIIAVDFRHLNFLTIRMVARIDKYWAARDPGLERSSIDAATASEVLDVEQVVGQWSFGRTDIEGFTGGRWRRWCFAVALVLPLWPAVGANTLDRARLTLGPRVQALPSTLAVLAYSARLCRRAW